MCYSYVAQILCLSHFVATLMGTQMPMSHLQWPPPPPAPPPAIADQTQSMLVEHDLAFWSAAEAADTETVATVRINFNRLMHCAVVISAEGLAGWLMVMWGASP